MTTGKTRQIYYGGAVPMIDVFLDKLDYCHEVNFKDRLGFDEYCISLTDIALQKLQIWEINDKDLKDLEFLMTVAEIGEDDAKKINRGYVARRLADDWGFWYTATTNLARVKAHVDGVAAPTSAIGDVQRALPRATRIGSALRPQLPATPNPGDDQGHQHYHREDEHPHRASVAGYGGKRSRESGDRPENERRHEGQPHVDGGRSYADVVAAAAQTPACILSR